MAEALAFLRSCGLHQSCGPRCWPCTSMEAPNIAAKEPCSPAVSGKPCFRWRREGVLEGLRLGTPPIGIAAKEPEFGAGQGW